MSSLSLKSQDIAPLCSTLPRLPERLDYIAQGLPGLQEQGHPLLALP